MDKTDFKLMILTAFLFAIVFKLVNLVTGFFGLVLRFIYSSNGG